MFDFRVDSAMLSGERARITSSWWIGKCCYACCYIANSSVILCKTRRLSLAHYSAIPMPLFSVAGEHCASGKKHQSIQWANQWKKQSVPTTRQDANASRGRSCKGHSGKGSQPASWLFDCLETMNEWVSEWWLLACLHGTHLKCDLRPCSFLSTVCQALAEK